MNSVQAIAFDFDGVFTDNQVIISEEGKEYSRCNRYDGYGISNLRESGIHMCCITSEIVPISKYRCQKLRLRHISAGSNDKLIFLSKWLDEHSIDPQRAAYLGNDINDISCMKYVGYPFCPADAHSSVVNYAQVLSKKGGYGVVRELADLLTKQVN